MAEKFYTKLTIEIQRPLEQWPDIISIEMNDACLEGDAFINNLVIPLMVATGYEMETINDALGRDSDE